VAYYGLTGFISTDAIPLPRPVLCARLVNVGGPQAVITNIPITGGTAVGWFTHGDAITDYYGDVLLPTKHAARFPYGYAVWP